VGPRTGLHDVKKGPFLTSTVLEVRLLGRPARSRSLYRQSYPGSLKEAFLTGETNAFQTLSFFHVLETRLYTPVEFPGRGIGPSYKQQHKDRKNADI
jgi:hypothetical protein